MFEEAIQLTGKSAEPVSVILAGIHGNERCGLVAFADLLPDLQIDRGQVFFIYGNPRAIKLDQRFVEANLNRLFRPDSELTDQELSSYEYGRAQFLKQYLDQAEVLLDLHGSYSVASQPFAIGESNARAIVAQLPVEIMVSGFDEIEPGGTDAYMNKTGKIGICLECGLLTEPSAVLVAKEAIMAFLKIRGHLTGAVASYNQERLVINQLYKTKTDNFYLTQDWPDFTAVKAGQIIGYDGSEAIKASAEGFILFATERQKIGEEAFILGKKLSTRR